MYIDSPGYADGRASLLTIGLCRISFEVYDFSQNLSQQNRLRRCFLLHGQSQDAIVHGMSVGGLFCSLWRVWSYKVVPKRREKEYPGVGEPRGY